MPIHHPDVTISKREWQGVIDTLDKKLGSLSEQDNPFTTYRTMWCLIGEGIGERTTAAELRAWLCEVVGQTTVFTEMIEREKGLRGDMDMSTDGDILDEHQFVFVASAIKVAHLAGRPDFARELEQEITLHPVLAARVTTFDTSFDPQTTASLRDPVIENERAYVVASRYK